MKKASSATSAKGPVTFTKEEERYKTQVAVLTALGLTSVDHVPTDTPALSPTPPLHIKPGGRETKVELRGRDGRPVGLIVDIGKIENNERRLVPLDSPLRKEESFKIPLLIAFIGGIPNPLIMTEDSTGNVQLSADDLTLLLDNRNPMRPVTKGGKRLLGKVTDLIVIGLHLPAHAEYIHRITKDQDIQFFVFQQCVIPLGELKLPSQPMFKIEFSRCTFTGELGDGWNQQPIFALYMSNCNFGVDPDTLVSFRGSFKRIVFCRSDDVSYIPRNVYTISKAFKESGPGGFMTVSEAKAILESKFFPHCQAIAVGVRTLQDAIDFTELYFKYTHLKDIQLSLFFLQIMDGDVQTMMGPDAQRVIPQYAELVATLLLLHRRDGQYGFIGDLTEFNKRDIHQWAMEQLGRYYEPMTDNSDNPEYRGNLEAFKRIVRHALRDVGIGLNSSRSSTGRSN